MKLVITGFRMVLVAGLLAASSAQAFPPAPDGIIYGLVKDQYGTPLTSTASRVILQTPGGVQISTVIQPNLAVGVNYMLHVPMDAGTFARPYASNALVTATQYKLLVYAGGITNLPIEMVASTPTLAKPAQMTQQNLTLGGDANGDGIPDAWEALFLQDVGTNVANIDPNADYAHDGRTLLQEYLLGNYPYNPGDNFKVRLVSQQAGSAVLSFTTMTGRNYSAYGSTDLQNWTPLSFTVPAVGATAVANYYAPGIQTMQIQTVQPAGAPQMQFFRVQLQ